MGDKQISLIVQTALNSCNYEKSCNTFQIPVSDVYERVSYYTGLSKILVQSIADKVSTCAELDRLLLLECVKQLIIQEKLPTPDNFYSEFVKQSKIKNTVFNHNLPIFLKQIRELGYKYRKSSKGSFVIMEDPLATFERYNYLMQIRRFRKNKARFFYYIDAKCFGNYERESENTDTPEKFAHFFMISQLGYENGLFTTQLKDKVFENWIVDILLPIMKPASVIIICNDQYLNPLRQITCYDTKAEMCQWLRDKNIPYDSSMCKAELYELIDKCTLKKKNHDIDRLLKSHGLEVLHLPSSFNMAPTKMLYQYIMNQNDFDPKKDIYNIRQSVLDVINHINKDKWFKFENVTINSENNTFAVDSYIEQNFDSVCELDKKYNLESFSVCNVCNITNIQN